MARWNVTDPVASLLTGAVATVAPSATLTDAARALTREHLGLLVVVDRRGVGGVLSERDIVSAAADGLDLGEERVIDHATNDIVTIDEDASIGSAAAQMSEAEVRHLAVTRKGQIIGVISVRDVVGVLAANHGEPAPAAV
jgi:CBS domain-containing protein